MISHMKITLVIDDHVLDRLRREAAKRKQTVSALVESALSKFLERQAPRGPLPRLPAFDGGGASVDVADREALHRAMKGR